MNVSEPSGRLANVPATSPNRAEYGLWIRTAEAAPIATPITASRTTGANLSRAASGWLSATTTSKPANTARTRTISSMAFRVRRGAALAERRKRGIVWCVNFACQSALPRPSGSSPRSRQNAR